MPFVQNQLFYRKLSFTLGAFILSTIFNFIFAQPVNDQCDNADEIKVAQNYLAIGTVVGNKISIDKATREMGELCSDEISELGNCGKTVWYKFTIGTTRNVAVVLKQQDSSIPQIFAGFTIYKVANCDYNVGNISKQLTPIGKFGSSGNSCLQAGTYYIQIAAREKSKGILWAEINISEPSTIIGNKWNNVDDLGIVKDLSISKNIDNFCLSIDSNEFKSNLPKGFTKSYWTKVEFRENAIQNIFTVQVYNGPSNINIGGYRIFRNAINIDSVTSNKPFTYFKRSELVYLIKESCKNPAPKEIVYIQFILLTDLQYFNIVTRSDLQIKDAWNTPDTDFEIITDNKFNKSYEKNFNCSGLLATHRCTNIPDSFVKDIPNTNFTDTFRYGAYIVVNSQEYGELRITGYDNQRYTYSPMLYILYKGDIRSGCDLVEVRRSESLSYAIFCVDPAIYTILVTRPNHYYRSTYIKLEISQRAIPKNVFAYRHDQPEQMGNVKPSSKKFATSSVIHIHNKDTTVHLDTFKKTGRFIFREFFLEEDGEFNLYQQNYVGQLAYYLFKGQFSNGTASMMSGENYNRGYQALCQEYKAGYYSILSWHDTGSMAYNTEMCELPNNKIYIQQRSICPNPPSNSIPVNAKPIFNNQDLLTGTSYKSDISYTYTFDYCFDCKSETPVKDRPIAGCARKPRIVNEDSLFFYYTFYIAKNAEVELPSYAILFRGDVKQNPDLVRDSFNVIDPCNPVVGNIYCNLKGGIYYTMVIYNPAYLQLPNRKIIVTPHQKSVNDFAINSRDLGRIETGTVYKSPVDVITCHTYFAETDPCALNYSNQMNCSKPYLKDKPYLDTLDKSRYRERQNLWYTFTVSDASNVILKVISKNFCNQRITVFKYNGNYEESFSELQFTGFDSTRTGLDYIAENANESSTNCRKNNVSFQNTQCVTNRYFVLIDGQYSPNASYQLEVSKTLTGIINSPGDQCSSPSKLPINKGGTYVAQTKNHCHSYGGSPYEGENDPNLKSTWFEINITKVQKYDLGIQYQGPIKIKGYSIYAGSCGALTKIVDLNDQFAYFSLSCMGIGKYYIQVITESYFVGDLKFQVTVEEKPNAPCKPYDFDQPLSGFEISGGCNNDTIWLNNRSTRGIDIRYTWLLNDRFLSFVEHPMLVRPDVRLQDKNDFKLVVRNLVTGKTDTTIVSFVNDTTRYFVEILQPKSFNCLDTIDLQYKTNYPHKLNLTWAPTYRFANAYSSNQRVSGIQNQKIYLTAVSENCILNDTLQLIGDRPNHFFDDNELCTGTMELKYDLSKFALFRVNNVNHTSKSLTITEPGKYALYYNYMGCGFYDTLDVVAGGSQIIKYFQHDSTFCVGDSLVLTSPKTYRKYDWGNNVLKDNITISLPGVYSLSGEINSCTKDIHTYTIKSASPNTNLLKDTTICKNDWYHFDTPYNTNKLLFKNPDVDSFRVTQDVALEVHVQDSFCVNKSKANVKMLEHSNSFAETELCLDNEDGIWIDAKNASTMAYNWLERNSLEPQFWADGYERYAVQRKMQNGCFDTLNIDVKENCPFVIFIPNAFSPNADGINNIFKPVVRGTFESYHLLIFNRWGEQLLNQNNGSWDGTYLGQEVPAGVYSVVIKVKVKNQVMKQYIETLTVLY